MRKPIIGLTPAHDAKTNDIRMRLTYPEALAASGVLPLILPMDKEAEDLKTLASIMDGFLFTGGPDVHPFLFREETHPLCRDVSPLRDAMELRLLSLVMELKKPVLGICRGIQLINIGLGGTIYQDLSCREKGCEPHVAHDQPFGYALPCHTVNLTPESRLARICGTNKLQVNSMHHQAVKQTAPGLNACGHSPDQVIEAVEKPDYPFLIGVQWHPEYLWKSDEPSSRLFHAFVAACSEQI